MFSICPKCQYQRQPTDTGDAGICPSCGLVFAKWVQHQLGVEAARARPQADVVDAADSELRITLSSLRARLTYVDERTDDIAFWGRVTVYVAFFIWGWY